MMFRVLLTGTIVSLDPWNAQIGMSLMIDAVFGFAYPDIGTAAANKFGSHLIASHAPIPPIDTPVTYTRLGSMFCVAITWRTAWIVSRIACVSDPL